MGSLVLDVVTAPGSEVIGQATVTQLSGLSNTKPINGFFPVLSPTGQKLANLQVSLVLEPLMASYDNHGSIPTPDVTADVGRSQDRLVMPQMTHPMPHEEVPTRMNNAVFRSPKSQAERQPVDYSEILKGQLNYGLVESRAAQNVVSANRAVAITANGDVISVPDSRAADINSHGDTDMRAAGRRAESPSKSSNEAGKDLLSMLVDRGNKLREAMVVSAMHTDQNPAHVVIGNSVPSGSSPADLSCSLPVQLSSHAAGSPKAAVDMFTSPVRKQDFQMYRMFNGGSPGTSLSSDAFDPMMSDLDDPLHENSILQELFYYHSDNELAGLGDFCIPNGQHHFQNPQPSADAMLLPAKLLGGAPTFNAVDPIEEPGNQRPPSRASSLTSLAVAGQEDNENAKKKTKRKARARSRSRSNSRSRSRSNTPSRNTKVLKGDSKENTSIVSKDSKASSKPRKKRVSRSRSRSGTRSGAARRKNSVGEMSDSDQMSTNRSDLSRTSFDPADKAKQEGLSVERLTLLGRVHVARVNIDRLHLSRPEAMDMSDSKLSTSRVKSGRPPRPLKSKKPCTYFVEYQFPVVATSKDKYTPNAMASEVTRVASKTVKNGALTFNHRSVFPIMFDGAAVEKWWKSALVFRVYCRETGGSPMLVGSGGVSLKSILRSDNLFIQRDIEIPDTSRNGLNSSRSASFNSSISSRSGSNILGQLKVSVELASDTKDFATVMARTKLAEMSGNTKVVPIGGMSSEQAKLVEQLNKNKNEPIVKAGMKKIDIPMSAENNNNSAGGAAGVSWAVKGLPPQSPRRKTLDSPQQEVEEGDEIAKLKHQLKATLVALGNQKDASAHMNSGAQVLSGSAFEPMTLHTMLLIQEGRNISATGVPPLHMVNKNPALLKAQATSLAARDAVARNTYLACRMFWCNDAVHSNVCWGTSNPEFNFLQVAPMLMTPSLLERMRDNYMIVEVWDKKVSADSDKLIGMVKLSLHQFYLSFRERKIANALLKSQYPVLAVDNYMPIVDLFTGLHFGQLKIVLAMGSEQQISTLQRLALDSSGLEPVPHQPASYMERQDLMKGGSAYHDSNYVEHQFEVVIEGIRGLQLFENMIWGEADCFVQFFFPAEGEAKTESMTPIKCIPTMKCFRTATTLCIPDPTFHDSSRHKLILPVGTPVQRDLLTACANSGGGVSGLPFEVWCRYYHPNVRDRLIAKSTLPLAKLCAMITMHKRGEPCVQSFSLRLSHVGTEGQQPEAETAAKMKDAGLMDVSIHYKTQATKTEASLSAVNQNHEGSQVCLSVGVLRAAGLKAAADSIAQLDPSMAYPAEVGVNAYVRIKISFMGKENERVTKTVARSFAPEFSHYIDFPCSLLVSQLISADSTSLAELLETAEAEFELWHQMPTGLHKEIQLDKHTDGLRARSLARSTGDVLLGTTVVPLMALLTKRTGLNGWFALNLANQGWAKPVDNAEGQRQTALDQVVGGLELSLRFAHQDDRDRVISVARSVGWSPLDLDVEQPDWQDEDSHHKVHQLGVSVDQVSFPLSCALIAGQSDLDHSARCYVRYKLYDKGAVVSKCRKLRVSDSGSLVTSLNHNHSFMLSHTAPLQWYLREEKLEIQAWVSYGRSREGEKKPRQRDKLVGSCYIDLDSLTDLRRRQQRISGLFPLFKPGTGNLKSAFIRAHVTSKISAGTTEQVSDYELNFQEDLSQSYSETDQSSDSVQQIFSGLSPNRSMKKRKKRRDKEVDPAVSFGVLLAVERAMHLPNVTEKNRSGEIPPTTYVSYQSAERSSPSYSSIFPSSNNPIWEYAVETRLSTEYLHKENKNLVLKVWHKPCDASKTPDKSSDRVLGFVSVDLSSLTKGLQQICGWYNIMDFNGQCRGQIKVSITPQDLQSSGVDGHTPSTSFMLPCVAPPSLGMSATSTGTQSVAASIAGQLMALQQQVMQRMGSLSVGPSATQDLDALDTTGESASKDQDATSCSENALKATTSFSSTMPSLWQPKLARQTAEHDPSKSYLFSSLRRQLQDLDNITERLKVRLLPPSADADTSQPQVNSARSGDILLGTHSGLSTIHTNSSLMNTRESSGQSRYNASSFEVGMSQESARSRTLNNSSFENAAVASGGRKEDGSAGPVHKLLDSGVFSTRNASEKSGDDAPDSQRSEKNVLAVTTSDNLSSHPSVLNESLPEPAPAVVGTLERGFLEAAAIKTQTLQQTGDNSESSQNSHGFFPGTHRSIVTGGISESQSTVGRVWTAGKEGGSSKSGSHSSSKHSHSGSRHSGSGSGSAANSVKNGGVASIAEDVANEDYESDFEEEEQGAEESARFGNYHHYRDMLDAEEDERAEGREGDDDEEDGEEEEEEDEGEIVEIIPKSLNNMSSVMALGDANQNYPTTLSMHNNYTSISPGTNVHVAETVPSNDLHTGSVSQASPNINGHEGTSVWCSDDNEDSFFQQVFEKNQRLMVESGAGVEELDVDSWLQEREGEVSHARLENWLESHSGDKPGQHHDASWRQGGNDAEDEASDEEEIVEEIEDVLEEEDDAENKGIVTQLRSEGNDDIDREDVRLQLGNDDTDEDVEGKEKGTVWKQDLGNSSDEETARNMWTEQQRENFFDMEENEEDVATARFQSLHLEEADESGMDKLMDLPPPFANAPVSLLSNVELMDSLASSNAVSSQTGRSNFTDGSATTDQIPGGDYPFTLELSDSHRPLEGTGEGARPKVKHLLSNVELESVSSSQRPHSGSSQGSRASHRSGRSSGSQASKLSSKSRASSVKSKDSVKSEKSSGKVSVGSRKSSGSEKASGRFEGPQNAENLLPEQQEAVVDASETNRVYEASRESERADNNTDNVVQSTEGELEEQDHFLEEPVIELAQNAGSYASGQRAAARKHSDRDSTLDSAFVEGDFSDGHVTHANSMVIVNGRGHLTPEDSGLGPAEGQVNGDVASMPNFFMRTEDMQASIRALQMAASAAAGINENNLRSHNKVKAVSELVNKMTSGKAKSSTLPLRNKEPPSSKEAERIARIFNSKMS